MSGAPRSTRVIDKHLTTTSAEFLVSLLSMLGVKTDDGDKGFTNTVLLPGQ